MSRSALGWANELASELSAELIVLHAVDTTALAVGNLAAVPGELKAAKMRAEESFREWQRESALPKVDFRVIEGPPFQKIADSAKELGADLVVMGTHGHSGVQRLLLGSVTEKVLHRVSVPLLTVSPSSASTTDSPSWKPRRILIALDFGPECESVIRHGLWLGDHYDAEVVVMHVVAIPYVVLNESTLEGLRPADIEKIRERLSEDRRRDLEKLLPEDSETRAKTIVRVGSAIENLNEVIGEEQIDLAVLGAGGHGPRGLSWLGSTCHKLVRAAPCPVLTVR
jgi:nucleotide-binding universal stress UspA family protein